MTALGFIVVIVGSVVGMVVGYIEGFELGVLVGFDVPTKGWDVGFCEGVKLG